VLALTHEILPKALTAFQARYPAVRVRIEALHSPQIVSSLLLHAADIGFAFNPPTHPNIVPTPLASTRMRCAVPRSMSSKAMIRKGAATLQELARLPIVALDGQVPLGSVVSQACQESGVGLRSAFTVQTYHAALAIAHHGLAVALVDGCTALSAIPDKVAVIDLEPAIPVHLCSLRQQHQSDSVAARFLLGCMKKAMAVLR
jgi:DNA-binding transcriptional LysR family regulator